MLLPPNRSLDLKIITSAENIEIKEAKKLHEAKHRNELGLFFFEGVHLYEEYIKSGKTPYRVFLTEDMASICPDFEGKRVITETLYKKITAEKAPQGIFTVAKKNDVNVKAVSETEVLSLINGSSVVLESMRDPGNVGTVIRTGASLGVDVIFTEDSADIFNPKVLRASMGAVFHDEIYKVPSATELAMVAVERGYDVYGTVLDPDAYKVGTFIPSQKSIFIIGNEGNGIKKETVLQCNKSAYIPMTNKTESLNAAIASTIFMWEIAKAAGDNK